MSATSSVPLAPLVRCWQRGWELACALAPAEEADGALHVSLDLPGRRVGRIVLDADQHPERVRAQAVVVAAAPGPDWLTVPTNSPEPAVRMLTAAGLEVDPGHGALMSVDLTTHPAPAPPAPYTAHLSEEQVVPGREARCSGSACPRPESRRRTVGSVLWSTPTWSPTPSGPNRGTAAVGWGRY